MTSRMPLIAYILSYGRLHADPGSLKTVPSVELQLLQIKTFAGGTGSGLTKAFYDQTTHAKTRFWLRPAFQNAVRFAKTTSGNVVVGDLVKLLIRLDAANRKTAWQVLRNDFPDLVSAKHFQQVRSGIQIKSDLDTEIFNKMKRKEREPAKDTVRPPRGRTNLGGKGTSQRSDMFAKSIELELREILKVLPDAGSTHVARELNARGIKSPMGGQWYPSSASNLLARCRKLRIIKI